MKLLNVLKANERAVILAVLCLVIFVTGFIIYDGGIDRIETGEEEKACMDKVLARAKIPNVGSMKCLLTEYNRCPKFDGSYKQCTNNYIPEPQYGNCPCHNRAFEMCPQKWKVAENVYEEGASECKPVEVDDYNPKEPSDKSRINWWRYNDEVPSNFIVQCK